MMLIQTKIVITVPFEVAENPLGSIANGEPTLIGATGLFPHFCAAELIAVIKARLGNGFPA